MGAAKSSTVRIPQNALALHADDKAEHIELLLLVASLEGFFTQCVQFQGKNFTRVRKSLYSLVFPRSWNS